jgi:uncharacterized low-complexity protein
VSALWWAVAVVAAARVQAASAARYCHATVADMAYSDVNQTKADLGGCGADCGVARGQARGGPDTAPRKCVGNSFMLTQTRQTHLTSV